MTGAERATPPPYLKLGETIAYVEAKDRVLVLDVAKNEAISEFTNSALSIWREALIAPSFEALVRVISSEYDASAAEITDDCRSFIADLINRDVLVAATGGSTPTMREG